MSILQITKCLHETYELEEPFAKATMCGSFRRAAPKRCNLCCRRNVVRFIQIILSFVLSRKINKVSF